MSWIPENKAAELIGYRPRTLRIYAQAGKFPVAYTHINGRKYHYAERDLKKLLNQNASTKQ